jgi:hypothetical protein
MSTWQHRRVFHCCYCEERSAVMSRPEPKIPTLEIGNTSFATTLNLHHFAFTLLYIYITLNFSVFCQITEFSYDAKLMGHSVYYRILTCPQFPSLLFGWWFLEDKIW